MSFKTIIQTRWKIEPDLVRIHPYGLFNIFAVVFGVLFLVLYLFYLSLLQATILSSIPFLLTLAFIIVLLWGIALTYIEFDNRSGQMRKMTFGIIPTTVLPFSKIKGINVVSNTMGGYVYRIYEKDAQYGRGMVVSSRYGKNDDPNAIAFVGDVVPLINTFLEHHSPEDGYVEPIITDFKYFFQEGTTFRVKNKKAGAIIFAIFFLSIAVSFFTMETDSPLVTLLMIVFMIFLALIFINAAFTKITIDPAIRALQRKGLIKFIDRKYSLDNYAGVQMLRRSVNFVYSGTDINLYFNIPEKNKQGILTISTMRKSGNIERFMKELYQIMAMPK